MWKYSTSIIDSELKSWAGFDSDSIVEFWKSGIRVQIRRIWTMFRIQESNPWRFLKWDLGLWDIEDVWFGIQILSLQIFDSDSWNRNAIDVDGSRTEFVFVIMSVVCRVIWYLNPIYLVRIYLFQIPYSITACLWKVVDKSLNTDIHECIIWLIKHIQTVVKMPNRMVW